MADTRTLPRGQWASVQWIYDFQSRVQVTIIVDSGRADDVLDRQVFNSNESVGGYYDTRQFLGRIHRLTITASVGGRICPENGFGQNQSQLYLFRNPSDPGSTVHVGAAFIHVFSRSSDLSFNIEDQLPRRGGKLPSKKASSKKGTKKHGAKAPATKSGGAKGGAKKAGTKRK